MKKLPHEKLTDILVDSIGNIKNDRIASALENVVLYFNNLTDAILGRTQRFVQDAYQIVDGVSYQVLELMDENAKLKAEIAKLKAKKKAIKKITDK